MPSWKASSSRSTSPCPSPASPEFAADRTLAGLLREEGTVGLDYARRYGEDLLSALQYLEEHDVQHRDIKPSNIGFTPSDKQARHLILFDFSLSRVDPAAITTGTAAYRDPFLRRRGRWDTAADRYAAAVTLHQMLTGVLPVASFDGAEGATPSVRIEAERFDASVREQLSSFFHKAFTPDAGHRHPSAEAMRHAWISLFEARPGKAAQPVAPVPAPAPEAPAAQAQPYPGLESVTLDTPVEGLPLTARARNALDRAGIFRVRDLSLALLERAAKARVVSRGLGQRHQRQARRR